MDIRRIETTGGFPITLDELKLDLRVDDGDEDQTLTRMMDTAAGLIERRTGYIIRAGVFETLGDSYCFDVMRAPFRDVISIAYMSAANVWTDVDSDNFLVVQKNRGFNLAPFPAYCAPCTFVPCNGWRLRFAAGFDQVLESGEDASSGDGDLPIDPLVRGVFIGLVAHIYENRELFAADKMTEIESTAGGLLNSIRQFW